MAHDNPFTLDLFGGSAPTGSFDLGVTAFPGGFANEPDDDPDPSSPAPAAQSDDDSVDLSDFVGAGRQFSSRRRPRTGCRLERSRPRQH